MTATLDAAMAGSHQIAVDCYVLYNRLPVTAGLNITAGSVTLDRTAAQRGRCTVTLAEPLLIPTPTGGTLTPYGYEIAVRRGVVHADGTREFGPLGVFPIQTSALDGVTLVTEIAGTDRSQLVVDARLEDDYTIAAGTNYGTAIRDLIAAGVPGLDYVFISTTYTTPALVFAAQADRWDAARQMAKSIGCEIYFDGTGRCVLRAEPTFGAAPLWTISDGEGGVMLAAALSLDRAPAYNRVVATGENTGNGTVPRGVWTDDNPGSPTYYFGPFGRKPRFYASTFITTPEQAVSAATALGNAQQGVARSLVFQSVPNSSMRPGDLILVRRPAMGVNELHLLDAMTIGLTAADVQSGTSRWGATSE
jgi:hypothetical protein